jgi:hypothetical protein
VFTFINSNTLVLPLQLDAGFLGNDDFLASSRLFIHVIPLAIFDSFENTDALFATSHNKPNKPYFSYNSLTGASILVKEYSSHLSYLRRAYPIQSDPLPSLFSHFLFPCKFILLNLTIVRHSKAKAHQKGQPQPMKQIFHTLTGTTNAHCQRERHSKEQDQKDGYDHFNVQLNVRIRSWTAPLYQEASQCYGATHCHADQGYENGKDTPRTKANRTGFDIFQCTTVLNIVPNMETGSENDKAAHLDVGLQLMLQSFGGSRFFIRWRASFSAPWRLADLGKQPHSFKARYASSSQGPHTTLASSPSASPHSTSLPFSS